MIGLFLRLLPAALLCVDGGSRYWKHVLAALLAYVLDRIIVRSSAWQWYAGARQPGEKTISDMLERLCLETSNADWMLHYALAKRINRESPTKTHIKNAAL